MVRLFEDTNIKAIADAIRAKNGTEETYKTSEMAAAIEAIQTGGGGNIDALINRSITEVSSNVTLVGENSFANCLSLASADFPLATKVSHNAFTDCGSLQSINIPLVQNIGQQTFSGCQSLTSACLPCVTFINSSAFYKCYLLETVDIGSTAYISGYAFRMCYSLKAFIMRSTEKNDLGATSAFLDCVHILGTADETYNPDGLKDGYFYVPRSLIDSYKADGKWQEYESQFRALEDYTVDGTTTGALDESKI